MCKGLKTLHLNQLHRSERQARRFVTGKGAENNCELKRLSVLLVLNNLCALHELIPLLKPILQL